MLVPGQGCRDQWRFSGDGSGGNETWKCVELHVVGRFKKGMLAPCKKLWLILHYIVGS